MQVKKTAERERKQKVQRKSIWLCAAVAVEPLNDISKNIHTLNASDKFTIHIPAPQHISLTRFPHMHTYSGSNETETKQKKSSWTKKSKQNKQLQTNCNWKCVYRHRSYNIKIISITKSNNITFGVQASAAITAATTIHLPKKKHQQQPQCLDINNIIKIIKNSLNEFTLYTFFSSCFGCIALSVFLHISSDPYFSLHAVCEYFFRVLPTDMSISFSHTLFVNFL